VKSEVRGPMSDVGRQWSETAATADETREAFG
jgi:hypothetical protein